MRFVVGLLSFAMGTFLAIRFGLWGIDAVRSGKVASAIFCFGFLAFGFLLGVLAIFLFHFNRGACLTVDGQRIDARYGVGMELHTDLANVQKIELDGNGKGICLHLTNRICRIAGLENAKELCHFISSAIGKPREEMTVDQATALLKRAGRKYTVWFALALLTVVLMFAHTGWCVLLTGGRDLAEFSKEDTIVFAGYAVAELATMILLFRVAFRCRNWYQLRQTCRFTLLSSAAIAHKNEGLEKYPGFLAKKFFYGYTYRIVIFSPESGVFAYMLERFDLPSASWMFCYESAVGFENLTDLYENLDNVFGHVVLED